MLIKSEIPSLPAQGGRETRTYECVYGHREWMNVAFIELNAAAAPPSVASAAKRP